MEADGALCFFCRSAVAVHSCSRHENCRVRACDNWQCKSWIDADLLTVLRDAYEESE